MNARNVPSALSAVLVEIRLRFCFESLRFIPSQTELAARIASRVCHVAFAQRCPLFGVVLITVDMIHSKPLILCHAGRSKNQQIRKGLKLSLQNVVSSETISAWVDRRKFSLVSGVWELQKLA